jgi:hypothetical protein
LLWIGLTGLAALLIVGFSAFVMSLMGTIERQDRQLRLLLDSTGAAGRGTAWAEQTAGRSAMEMLADPAVEIVRPAIAGDTGSGRAVVLLDREGGKGILILSRYRGNATAPVILRMQNDGMERPLGTFFVPDSSMYLCNFTFPPRSRGILVVRQTAGGVE